MAQQTGGKGADATAGRSPRAMGSQTTRDAHDAAIVGTHTANLDAGAPVQHLAQQLAAQAQQKRLRARRPPARHQTGGQAPAWTNAAAASPAQRAGMQAEEQVCQYLQSLGVRILARNAHTRRGEIDVVCVDAGVLAFVEVRRRSHSRYGGAAASVGRAKQQRIVRAAQAWLPRLTKHYFSGKTPPCRFDVATVEHDGICWLKQAFEVEV